MGAITYAFGDSPRMPVTPFMSPYNGLVASLVNSNLGSALHPVNAMLNMTARDHEPSYCKLHSFLCGAPTHRNQVMTSMYSLRVCHHKHKWKKMAGFLKNYSTLSKHFLH